MHAAIVGQAPARGSREPLDGRTGRRLERLAGIREGELGMWFALGNLLPAWPGNRERRPGPHSAPGDRFDLPAARESWEGLVRDVLLGEFDVVLLLGGNVAAAAGLRAPHFEWTPIYADGVGWHYGFRSTEPAFGADCQAAVVPHPSGASHFWNRPENHEQTSDFLRGVVRELAR